VARLVFRLFLLGFLACSSERRGTPPEENLPRPGPAVWESADQSIAWKPWTAAAFQEARRRDCPVLLYLAAPGGEGLFAGGSSSLRFLAEERFVALRVDPFQRPDIARRYATGGWPALVVMDPDGRAFAAAVDIPTRNVEMFLLRLLNDYAEEREIIEAKIRRAARRREQTGGYAIDVEPVYRTIAAAFDTVYGGFGQGPKFVEAGTLEFLLEYHAERRDPDSWRMVEQTLDAILGSPLLDPVHGGVCAYSHTPDWQTPVREKDALDQAGLLLVLLATSARGRPDHAAAARGLIDYVEAQLFDGRTGAFRGRQVGLEEGWWTDPLIYADRHAVLIRACIAGVRHLQDEGAERMVRSAAAFLLERCIDEEGAVHHTCSGSGVRGLLEDQVLVSQALLDLHALSGEEQFSEGARRTIDFMGAHLFDRQTKAFVDRPEAVAVQERMHRPAVPYRDGGLPAGNALAAELYMRLNDLTRAGTLLRGKRLGTAPGRAHSGCARAVLRYEKAASL